MPGKTSRPLSTRYVPQAPSKPNFGLPTFTFDHQSLTEGTNIPAPSRDPSPAPPAAKKQEAANPLRSHPTTPDGSTQNLQGKGGARNGNGPTSAPTEAGLNTNTAVTAVGAVPGMKRPHHVRRLLSMRSLSQAFNSHGRTDSMNSAVSGSDFGPPTGRRTPSIFGRSSSSTWGRPESRGGESIMGSTYDGGDPGKRSMKKRMSGSFWSRRSSFSMSRMMQDNIPENAVAPQRKRTPPPQLPEIGSLKIGKELHEKNGGFLSGDDMFKGIEYKPEI